MCCVSAAFEIYEGGDLKRGRVEVQGSLEEVQRHPGFAALQADFNAKHSAELEEEEEGEAADVAHDLLPVSFSPSQQGRRSSGVVPLVLPCAQFPGMGSSFLIVIDGKTSVKHLKGLCTKRTRATTTTATTNNRNRKLGTEGFKKLEIQKQSAI